MIEQPGYKYLQEVLAAQVKARTDAVILNSLPGMDAVLEQEYKKGEAAGIQLAANFASIRLGVIADQINELLKPKEGQGNENDQHAE